MIMDTDTTIMSIQSLVARMASIVMTLLLVAIVWETTMTTTTTTSTVAATASASFVQHDGVSLFRNNNRNRNKNINYNRQCSQSSQSSQWWMIQSRIISMTHSKWMDNRHPNRIVETSTRKTATAAAAAAKERTILDSDDNISSLSLSCRYFVKCKKQRREKRCMTQLQAGVVDDVDADITTKSTIDAYNDNRIDRDIDTNKNSVVSNTIEQHGVSGVALSSSSSPSSSLSRFESFDYLSHWYPVLWVKDLVNDRPTKVTLFDVDYVIAKSITSTTGHVSVAALVDKCPHKQAALSEGRVISISKSKSTTTTTTTSKATNSSLLFQCGYHGWSFHGTTGQCVEIPQIIISSRNDGFGTDTETDTIKFLENNRRSCAKSIPIQIHQGMVWIFPGGYGDHLLLSSVLPPPTIHELETNGYYSGQEIIRDFDIDYSILLENIMDPDHGLFAHQAKGFDLYSASTKYPMSIEEQYPHNGTGWTITSRVEAVEKVAAYDQLKRRNSTNFTIKQIHNNKQKTTRTKESTPSKIATTTFYAPTVVVMGRRDVITKEANFLTTFYICPVGTGRSRFMSRTISKMNIPIPRWLMHIAVNNFVDEDTYLLATQQRYILKCEAQTILKQQQQQQQEPAVAATEAETETVMHSSAAAVGGDGGGVIGAIDADYSNDIITKKHSTTTHVRRNQYVYKSPSEKLAVRLGSFWDHTLSRVPNRIPTLVSMYNRGNFDTTTTMSRAIVLDRYQQHLQICPDSQRFVKNCERIQLVAKVLAWTIILVKIVGTIQIPTTSATTIPTSAVSSKFVPTFILHKLGTDILKLPVIISSLLVSFLVTVIVNKLKKEFYYKFDESFRNRKVDGIPNVWLDRA